MSMPKKGSRSIVVDGQKYLWRIRKHATHEQRHEGYLNVSIELADVKGTALVVRTDRPHPEGIYFSTPVTPVLPNDVAGWIRQALKTGWQPSRIGSAFFLEIPVLVIHVLYKREGSANIWKESYKDFLRIPDDWMGLRVKWPDCAEFFEVVRIEPPEKEKWIETKEVCLTVRVAEQDNV